jgi:electron transfer flavoprotein beta subunit
MRQIIVCIKQVPDFSRLPEVPIDSKTGTLIRQGMPSIINPFDRHALEEALRLRQAYGGRVMVISMGPPQAREALQDALIMGADGAVLLTDPAFAGGDTLATAYVLAAAIRKLGPFDLVLCGRETIDSGTGHIAPSLAECLDLPQITYVRRMEVQDGRVLAERTVEDGYQVIEAALPLVISVTKEINVPRPLALRGVGEALKKELAVWGCQELGISPERVGLAGSPTQVPRILPPQPRQGTELLEGSPEEVAEALVARLRELKAV